LAGTDNIYTTYFCNGRSA